MTDKNLNSPTLPRTVFDGAKVHQVIDSSHDANSGVFGNHSPHNAGPIYSSERLPSQRANNGTRSNNPDRFSPTHPHRSR